MRWIDPKSGAVIIQEKLCPRCKQSKPIAEFPWRKATRQRPYDGPAARCYACERLRGASRRERLRRPARINPNIIFTPCVLAELRACIDGGLSPVEAAEKMGLSVSSVVNARANHGLPRFRRKPSRNSGLQLIPRIARLARAGLEYREIGACIGKSKDAVCGIIHRNRQRFNLELQANEAGRSVGAR